MSLGTMGMVKTKTYTHTHVSESENQGPSAWVPCVSKMCVLGQERLHWEKAHEGYFSWIEQEGFRTSLYWKSCATGSGNISMWIKVPIHSFFNRVSDLRPGPISLLGSPPKSLLYLLISCLLSSSPPPTYHTPPTLPPPPRILYLGLWLEKSVRTDSHSFNSLILGSLSKNKVLFFFFLSLIYWDLPSPGHEVGKL